MTRPIVWAFGMLATAALSATAAGDRIAARFGLAGSRPAPLQRSSEPSRTLTLSADLYGHFVVHPALNGQRVRMLVDTGASFVALSHEDAAMLGLKVVAEGFHAPQFDGERRGRDRPGPHQGNPDRRHRRARRRSGRAAPARVEHQLARHVVPEASRRLRGRQRAAGAARLIPGQDWDRVSLSPAERLLRARPLPNLRAPMFPKPQSSLTPNTYAFESLPLVKPTGFREYDARWLFETEINLMGVQALGLGIGTLVHEMGVRPDLVT